MIDDQRFSGITCRGLSSVHSGVVDLTVLIQFDVAIDCSPLTALVGLRVGFADPEHGQNFLPVEFENDNQSRNPS